MLHHPDKNKDDNEAAEKFREITEAYEVLGNFRLRKLYDKGIIHTAGQNYPKPEAEPEEDDPTAKFYKARMRKEHPTATGRTPIYDFDAWNDAHYSGEIKRQQKLSRMMREKRENAEIRSHNSQTEAVVLLVLIFFGFYIVGGKNFDVDHTKDKKNDSKPSDSG